MDCFRIRIECGKRIYSNEILAKQLQVFGYLFQITMERFLREAITRFPVEHPLDETVLDTYEQKGSIPQYGNGRWEDIVQGTKERLVANSNSRAIGQLTVQSAR